MAIEEVIIRLLFGIEKDTTILSLNFQDDAQMIGLSSCDSKLNNNDRLPSNMYDHIHLVKSNINNLPLLNNSFNIVILKGILTNLNLQKKGQKAIFENIFSLLKSDGIFYLAIENKFALSLFAEKKYHLINKNSKRQNTTIIPNKLLYLSHKIKYFQTYLFSSRAYKKLLEKIGFEDVVIYGAPLGYNYPCIISLEKYVYSYFCQHLDSPRKGLKNNLIILFNMLGINKYFCQSYILIANKRGA